MSTYYNPVEIYSGSTGCRQLADKLNGEYASISSILLLTRGGCVESSKSLLPLQVWMQKKTVKLKELSISNPNLSDIVSLKTELNNYDFQLIIAIGGGSVMDVAKTISAIQHLRINTVEDLRSVILKDAYALDKVTPWIGIPTTAGTGSEVTKWATVWDTELSCKYSISKDVLYAKKALVIPDLMQSMSLRLSFSTGLDALSHAVEAYWSVMTNPISRIYALTAIELIRIYLPQLISDPTSIEIREQLAMASLYSGLAFSNTRTTACHSISYPLSLIHGIDHGIAVSLLLGSVSRINEPALIEREKLYMAFGIKGIEGIGQIVQDLYRLYRIPYNLREYGVTEKTIPEITASAFTKGRMDNNPVEISEAKVQEILINLL